MRPLNTLKVLFRELKNIQFDVLHSLNLVESEQEKSIVKEIRNKGYFVVKNAFSKEWCQKVIAEIDELLEKYKDQIWKDEKGSDHRIMGANHLSSLINEFYQDPFILKILQTYERAPYKNGFTLGAKLLAANDNVGSGGGWHRDDANTKQTKAILYLNDVQLNNGPFQYIEGSHKPGDIYRMALKYNFSFGLNRFSDQQLDKVIQNYPDRLKTFTGEAGTLLLTDTRGLHRGMPIKKGVRFALTNYNWVRTEIPEHIEKQIIRKNKSH